MLRHQRDRGRQARRHRLLHGRGRLHARITGAADLPAGHCAADVRIGGRAPVAPARHLHARVQRRRPGPHRARARCRLPSPRLRGFGTRGQSPRTTLRGPADTVRRVPGPQRHGLCAVADEAADGTVRPAGTRRSRPWHAGDGPHLRAETLRASGELDRLLHGALRHTARRPAAGSHARLPATIRAVLPAGRAGSGLPLARATDHARTPALPRRQSAALQRPLRRDSADAKGHGPLCARRRRPLPAGSGRRALRGYGARLQHLAPLRFLRRGVATARARRPVRPFRVPHRLLRRR